MKVAKRGSRREPRSKIDNFEKHPLKIERKAFWQTCVHLGQGRATAVLLFGHILPQACRITGNRFCQMRVRQAHALACL